MVAIASISVLAIGYLDREISIMTGGLFPDLSESHRSRIRVTLTLLDEALVKFEEWAQGREVRSLLYIEENTLTPDERAKLLAAIAEIRCIIKELRDDMGLAACPQDIMKTIRGHCYLLWINVLEMTSKYLRGFGEPPQELIDYLDPRANSIMHYLDDIKILLLNH
jgi:hypothetical protein